MNALSAQDFLLSETESWNRQRSNDELRGFIENQHEKLNEIFDDEELGV